MTDGGQRPQQPRRPLRGAAERRGAPRAMAAPSAGGREGSGSHATVEGRESKVLIESFDIILKIPV